LLHYFIERAVITKANFELYYIAMNEKYTLISTYAIKFKRIMYI
jgi:hypothetical protein